MINTKRVYEPRTPGDGRRFLVERLWPRGMSKEKLTGVEWLKEVAPSPELRRWYGHDVEKWPEFRRRYLGELRKNPATLQPLLRAAQRGNITLLYSAHDTAHNSAIVLQDYLRRRAGPARQASVVHVAVERKE